MRRAAKIDATHSAIVTAFRRCGVHVVSLAANGHGVPDLLCAARGHSWLVEVKDGAKPPSARKLTPQQEEFHARWPGKLYIANGVDDVPDIIQAAIGACRECPCA